MHHHHDLIYPLLSGVLAVFGSWTALDLFRRARRHDGEVVAPWVALSAIAMGVSIWSMHFIAMLGFDPGAPVSYALGLTLSSLALAVVGTALAFAICAAPGAPARRIAGGGALMGLSIGGMHYLGMSALRTAAVVGYRLEWVVASVIVALLASSAALAAAQRDGRPAWRGLAAVVLGAGIVAMHYTAMAAVVLTPGPSPAAGLGVPALWLAAGVAGLTLFLLFLALGASLLDQRHVLLLALQAGRLGYWEMEVTRRRLTLSEQGRELLGFRPDDAFDQSRVAALLTPESASARAERLERSIATASDYEADYEMRDGRWLEVRGRMLLDSAGRAHRLVGTIQDVTSHRVAFQSLARSEARQRILINELNHRVKNTLATILSISALSARKAETVETFTRSFQARLMSLSATHDLLTVEGWERAEVRSIFEAEFGPYEPEQWVLSGPQLWLQPETVLAIGLITHELATNAAKYGALSCSGGQVDVTWSILDDAIRIAWRERNGPQVTPPRQQGFGSRLINATARKVDFRYPETGFEADILIKLAQKQPDILHLDPGPPMPSPKS
ncbi:hypothetical protein BH10PSE1_BH10PSE1_25190 [soil metagenome]